MNGTFRTYKAGGLIKANHFVTMTDDATVVAVSAVTDLTLGVCDNFDYDEGDSVDVKVAGLAEVAVSGTVDRLKPVTINAEGAAVAVADSNSTVVGKILEAGADGAICSILLK